LCSSKSFERRRVTRCDDGDGSIARFREDVLDEFTYFSAALSDERNHHDVGTGSSGERAEKHAFPDARAREETDALADSQGQESVDCPDAGRQRCRDLLARERGRRTSIDGEPRTDRRSLAVEGPAESIENAADEAVPDSDVERAGSRRDRVVRSNSREIAERHREDFSPAETDDLREQWSAAASDGDDVSDACTG
jgi:hypothetical protein